MVTIRAGRAEPHGDAGSPKRFYPAEFLGSLVFVPQTMQGTSTATRAGKKSHWNTTDIVSLEDAIFVVDHNAGHPLFITFVTTFPANSSPTKEQLCLRILELQQAFPLLCSDVCDMRTTAPYYKQRDFAWQAEEIYRERGESRGGAAEVFKREWRESKEQVGGPQWHVTRYQGETVYFALTISHILTDGHGAMRLNQLLFNHDQLRPEPLGIPSLGERIDTKLSIKLIVWLLYRFMVVPLLPWILQYLLVARNIWIGPYNGKARQPPTECEDGVQVTTILVDTFLTAKALAKTQRVPTAHSLLYMAYLTAIWSVCSKRQARTTFLAQMPTSERDAHPDFGHCTGNYFGATMMNVDIKADGDFFAACRKMFETYGSVKGQDESRRMVGIRGLLKAKLNDPSSKTYRQNRPTNHEDAILDIAEGSRPFRFSTSFSNLTRTSLPEGAIGLCWSLSSSALQPPLTIDVVGHERAIELVTTWKEGAAMNAEQIDGISKRFDQIMTRLAKWKSDVPPSFLDLISDSDPRQDLRCKCPSIA